VEMLVQPFLVPAGQVPQFHVLQPVPPVFVPRVHVRGVPRRKGQRGHSNFFGCPLPGRSAPARPSRSSSAADLTHTPWTAHPMPANDPRGTDPTRPAGRDDRVLLRRLGSAHLRGHPPARGGPAAPGLYASPPPRLPRLDEEDPDEPFIVDG
jgi:hypothetical protein